MDTGWRRNRYGGLFRVDENYQSKATNEFMNELIRGSVKRIEGSPTYKKYDDDLEQFEMDNPDVVLAESNEIIDEWTKDSGGYHTNTGVMKYLTEDKKMYGTHEGWEKGVRELDQQIKGKLNTDVVTYRTIQVPVEQLQVGQIVDQDGFIATGINRSRNVAAFNHGDAHSSTIEVDVDKGTRCLFIGSKTGHHSGNENELLFPTEYQIRITDKKIEYDSDGDYIRTIFKGKMIEK